MHSLTEVFLPFSCPQTTAAGPISSSCARLHLRTNGNFHVGTIVAVVKGKVKSRKISFWSIRYKQITKNHGRSRLAMIGRQVSSV
jgi:hypothetical protein